MTKPLINRRSVLVGSAAVVGSAAAWTFKSWQDQHHPLSSSSAVHRLGARFSGHYSVDPMTFWKGPAPLSETDWGSRLEQLRQEDFDANRLVEVDGWWLAETEIHFCVYLYETG